MSGGRLSVFLLAIIVTLVGAGGAGAHQTATNNGVTVTVHVTANDEPIAGQPSFILVTRVKTRIGKFAWLTCRCTLQVSDSARNVLLNQLVKPSTEMTFPVAGAYRIDFAGRVKRNGAWRTFKVTFAIRAYEVSGEAP